MTFHIRISDQEQNLTDFAHTVFDWSHQGLKRHYEIISSDIGIDSLTQNLRSGKPLDGILFSYNFAINIESSRIVFSIPEELLSDLIRNVICRVLELKGPDGDPFFDESEIPIFQKYTAKYLVSISEHLANINARALSAGPGGEVVDDLMKEYKLDDTTIDYYTKQLISVKLTSSITSLIEVLNEIETSSHEKN